MDNVSFLGYNIIPPIKRIVPVLQKIDPQVLLPIANLSLGYLSGAEIGEEEFEAARNAAGIEKEPAAHLFTGLFYILRKALRGRVKSPEFRSGLEELRIPEPVISALWKLFLARFVLDKNKAIFS